MPYLYLHLRDSWMAQGAFGAPVLVNLSLRRNGGSTDNRALRAAGSFMDTWVDTAGPSSRSGSSKTEIGRDGRGASCPHKASITFLSGGAGAVWAPGLSSPDGSPAEMPRDLIPGCRIPPPTKRFGLAMALRHDGRLGLSRALRVVPGVGAIGRPVFCNHPVGQSCRPGNRASSHPGCR